MGSNLAKNEFNFIFGKFSFGMQIFFWHEYERPEKTLAARRTT